MIRISEDVAEIIDFGPRYELDDTKMKVSVDARSGCGGGCKDVQPDDFSVDGTPTVTPGKSNSHRKLSVKQLKIVKSIINSASADNDELEDGEFILDQLIEKVVAPQKFPWVLKSSHWKTRCVLLMIYLPAVMLGFRWRDLTL